MNYTVEELRERLDDILQEVRTGERVEIVENGHEIARIQAVQSKAAGNGSSIENRLREFEEEGIISRQTEPRATLEDVRRELEEAWSVNPPKPGGLARFLESR
ncbi:MAG: type II toxin-antitoxin system prevent-host-death family antitoxin [Thermoanaerobaculia bacterium]